MDLIQPCQYKTVSDEMYAYASLNLSCIASYTEVEKRLYFFVTLVYNFKRSLSTLLSVNVLCMHERVDTRGYLSCLIVDGGRGGGSHFYTKEQSMSVHVYNCYSNGEE